MKVEIYSDVVCPWCYIGERRFLRALEASGAEDVEVIFRPFQLDPSAAEEARPLSEYLSRRFGAMASAMTSRVTQLGEAEGIRFDWERAQAVNTLRAHRLMRLAEGEPLEVRLALVEGLFRAHFSEGRNVGDDAELVAIAGAAGVDTARAAQWLSSGEGEEEVRAAIEEARAIGVESVPTFVFDDRFALEGAQAVETFVAALDEVREHAAEDS